jgi:membrane-associated phospholipid phosphatase
MKKLSLLLIIVMSCAAPAAAQDAAQPVPDVTHLFTDTVRDVKRLPSRDTLMWLTIGAAAAIAGHPEDARITRSVSGARVLREPLEAGATIGGTPLQLGAAITAYAIGRGADKPRVALLGADLIRAQVIAEGLTFAIKQTVRRSRPEGSGFSFSSGHTAVSFASATVLQRHLGWKAGVPAYAIATYVAASRVQTKKHYFSDVAFGAAVGIIAGRTVTAGRVGRFVVAPAVGPGTAGASFTWVGKP